MLELENQENSKRADDLEHENQQISKELQKLQLKYKNEVVKIEKENEMLKKSLEQTGDAAKINIERLRNLEIDNEGYERQLRYVVEYQRVL